ncbi:hypothetical protein ERT44_17960 [Stenotrophomonas sp. MA5]|nr:hypothetical protein ERT44_17960 [Stenotrophomonas sp. MA5]
MNNQMCNLRGCSFDHTAQQGHDTVVQKRGERLLHFPCAKRYGAHHRDQRAGIRTCKNPQRVNVLHGQRGRLPALVGLAQLLCQIKQIVENLSGLVSLALFDAPPGKLLKRVFLIAQHGPDQQIVLVAGIILYEVGVPLHSLVVDGPAVQ